MNRRMITAIALAAAALVPAVPANVLPMPSAAQAASTAEVTTLADAVGLVQVTEEDRTGYTPRPSSTGISGKLHPTGATRAEVLIAEAVVAPTLGAGCKLTGGALGQLLRRPGGHQCRGPGHRRHGRGRRKL